MGKRKLHCGYKLNINELKAKIGDIIGPDLDILMRNDIYTAVMFHTNEPQQHLEIWYRKRKNKTIIGYLKELYVHTTKKGKVEIVGWFVIDGVSQYIALSNGGALELKSRARHGIMGDPIILPEKIEILFEPYMEYAR